MSELSKKPTVKQLSSEEVPHRRPVPSNYSYHDIQAVNNHDYLKTCVCTGCKRRLSTELWESGNGYCPACWKIVKSKNIKKK